MTFTCPIHGHYTPTQGTTVAICPQCQFKPAPPPSDGSILNDTAAATLLKQALARAESAEARSQVLEDALREITSGDSSGTDSAVEYLDHIYTVALKALARFEETP